MDEPTELGSIAKVAAFACAVAGIFAAGAGFQVAAFLLFRETWAGWFPWIELLAGLGCVWLAVQLAHPRVWALGAAVALLSTLFVTTGAWAAWLLWSGFFSPLVLGTPIVIAGALALLPFAAGDLRRVGAVRAAAEAEFASFVDPDAAARAGNRWFLPVVYLGGAAVLLPLALAIFAPARFEWVSTRVRGLAAGRNPFGDVLVTHATDYPYSGSPLAWYLETEARYTSVPTADVLAVADRIATNVGWRLSAETGIADPVAAEAALWDAGRAQDLPLWIAAELRGINAFYSPESLFSRSFDPDAHVLPDQVHMDCDQLVWFFLHVASRLDLAMAAVPSPMHVYLRYAGPSGQPPLYVETTQFRNIVVDRDHMDMLGPALGEDFWIEEDYYASGRGGTYASARLVEAAGLYRPWTERDIRDAILGNVLVGVEEAGLPVDVVAEAERQVAGSRDITLVANLYGHHVARAKEALAAQHPDAARAAALRARELRATYGSLVIVGAAAEEDILAGLEAE